MQHLIQIRRFNPGDEPALLRVYFCAIHQIAFRDYSSEQIEGWAPAQMDTALWAKHIQHIQPFVAELGNEIVGYADVQKNGYIDHFFVSGLYPRQGIGTRLMGRIHEEAMSVGLPELRSEVSKTAEPFFARHGFHVLERRVPVRRGVTTRRTLSPPRQRARHLSQTAPPTHESPRR